MLSPWDLLLIPLTLLPGLLIAGFRWRMRRRGGTTAAYQVVATAAGLLLVGPIVYMIAVVVPRFDRQDTDLAPGAAFILIGLLGGLALGLTFMLWQAYYVDRDLRGSQWSMRQYVKLNLRFVALIAIPAGLMGALVGILPAISAVRQFLDRLTDTQAVALLLIGVATLGTVVTVLLMPALIKWLLATRPLADQALANELMTLGDRLGVPITDIRVMTNPGARLANALVTGFSRRQRTVVLTDTMLEHMTQAELMAVFAHECGHVRRRHLWARVGIQFGIVLLLGGSANLVMAATDRNATAFPLIFALAAFLPTLVSGPFIRQQEFSADRFAGELTDPAALASALAKLEALNLGPRPGRLPLWLQWLQTHPPTAQRIARLLAMTQPGSDSPRPLVSR